MTLLSIVTRLCDGQTLKPDILTTAGGYNSNATGSLSWTLGEPIIETGLSATNLLTQGFQQDSYTIAAVEKINSMNTIKVEVFPNPFTSYLDIKNEGSIPLQVQLKNMDGVTIYEKNIDPGQSRLNLPTLSAELYLLEVYDNDHSTVQTFKIMKMN